MLLQSTSEDQLIARSVELNNYGTWSIWHTSCAKCCSFVVQSIAMNRAVALSIMGFSLLLHADLVAQEDNWWRKLFRKEATEEQQERDTTKVEKDVEVYEIDALPSGREADTLEEDAPPPTTLVREPGHVVVAVPEGIDALDSLYRATPPPIRGYRVQIYFGDLTSAREQRRLCMESLPDLPCYLVQNPPNFAVMIGDYRTHLDAYREALNLAELYPTAVVVPTAIEPPHLSRTPVE